MLGFLRGIDDVFAKSRAMQAGERLHSATEQRVTALIDKLRGKLERGGHGALAARVLGSGFAAVSVKIAAAGLSYLMFVIMAKLLSQAEYGKFAFGFNLAIVVATIAGLGATTAIMRFWPQYDGEGRNGSGSRRAAGRNHLDRHACAVCAATVIAVLRHYIAAMQFA